MDVSNFDLRVLLTLFLALTALALSQERLESRVFEIARQLRCPTCVSSSVADSNAPISVEMRRLIQEQLEAGKSEREILSYFQETHGDWILLNPPRRGIYLLAWGLPILVGLAALALLVYFVRRWTKSARAPLEVSAEELERVRRELRGETR